MNDNLSAIYELRRQGLLLAKLNPATRTAVTAAMAFAYAVRLCPIYHSKHNTVTDVRDPFEDAYAISRETVDELISYCRTQWSAGEKPSFYDLEDKFKIDRMGIYAVLRYEYLSGGLEPADIEGLLTHCPMEVKDFARPFEEEELQI